MHKCLDCGYVGANFDEFEEKIVLREKHERKSQTIQKYKVDRCK